MKLYCCTKRSQDFRIIDILEDEIRAPIHNVQKACICAVSKKVNKSVWGMPRLLEATKDVVSCEKHRGFANET